MRFISLKIKRIIKEGITDFRYFGFKVMIAKIYWILADESVKSIVYRNRILVQWLTLFCKTLIERYQNENKQENILKAEASPIWVFWWQGKEDMPDIIRLCHKSKIRCAGKHPVILLTKDNLHEYVYFPEYVWNQFENGQLCIQHLADMIRVQLIQKYGGIWLDASVYCIHSIPEEVFEMEIFSLRGKKDEQYVSECRWTTWAIGGQKDNILCTFLNDFFLEYCKRGKPFIDYYMFDCAIAVGYNNFLQLKSAIDQLKIAENSYYWLNEHLKEDADSVKKELAIQNIFQKISWKSYLDVVPEKQSLYAYLKQKESEYEYGKS